MVLCRGCDLSLAPGGPRARTANPPGMQQRFTGERLADLKLRGVLLVIASIAVLVAVVGAILVHIVDEGIGTWGDAFWWAVSTVTTTGFGDVVPTDPAGRVVGVVLMLVGISLIPTITSLVVAVFIAQRSRENDEQDKLHRDQVLARLDELEVQLQAIAGRQTR
jgi:voltage-gated potassium channel